MPPRRPARRGVLHLPADDHAARFVEERVRVAAHDEQRHQVLEQRGAPRQQHGRAVDARDESVPGGTSASRARRPWRWRRSWRDAPPMRADRRTTRRSGPGRRRPPADTRSKRGVAAGCRGTRSSCRRRSADARAASSSRRRPRSGAGAGSDGSFTSMRRPDASVMSAPARLPLSTVEMYAGGSGASVDVSYQFSRCPSNRSSPSTVVSVASSLAISVSVSMNPKSCAASVESRPMPMLVGDVRCAIRAPGSSCTLSGGRWWWSASTNASKYFHVVCAIDEKVVAVDRRGERRRPRAPWDG